MCQNCPSYFPLAGRECADWIYPLFDYRHKGVKDSIWQLKYKGKRQVGEVLGVYLYERILEELDNLEKLHNFTDPVFVAVPLSFSRHRKRGFNQAKTILNSVIKQSGKKFRTKSRVLLKTKHTEKQARTGSRKERLENIKGSFVVRRPQRIKGRNIILIDDVITTGATLGEARKVLLKAGAKKVFAFTVAH